MAEMETQTMTTTMKRVLLLINIILLSVGNCGGPLVMRLYFLHGGKRVWFSSWLETAGWPVILLPITIGYLHRRRTQPSSPTKFFFIKPPLFMASAVIGILTGFDDYIYAYGMARLPVSTSSLILASQLAFTAGFAFVLVKQKFTSYSINAVFLLTLGAAVLGLHTDNDRPKGESNREYVLGFLMTVGAAALYGFILPLVELAYKKGKQEMSYALVMEIQMFMCLFATLFATVGMLVNNDFKVIGREARKFDLGEVIMEIGDIAELCSSLSIKEGDGPVNVLGEGLRNVGGQKMAVCLVGKVFADKLINRDAFRGVIGRIWRTIDEVVVEVIRGNIFAFHFRLKLGEWSSKHLFVWRACCDLLPTRFLLAARRVPVDVGCPLCGAAVESILHSLWLCISLVKAKAAVPFLSGLRLPSTAAWPVILLPITVTYLRCCHISPAKFFFIKPPVFIAAAIIGVITGFNNYLYTYGQACLPVSTTSLIIATSLAFTAGFAFLLVMQKFTSYSINAVVLLTIGAGVLALDTSSDRPKNESQRVHARIFHDAGSISLYGFVLPLVELTYKKANQ
ncbi:hypothetical protein JRO89_XS07G0124700 [Xanthoceras sorbifolium]|uniref:Probable purine permease n=1 Tax=Xanthoceras sorbifolium TaxID=99658 RepID=A0ABQ8HTK7_9ROSI|nr:hypothetical protein JRO89_XS07G0124700 [Xanthoceras sorbifolium]